jgi:dienelactone hydrolase
VVCSIDHPYHSLYTRDADGHLTTADPAFVREVTGASNDSYDEATDFKLAQKWMRLRTADIGFVLDTVKQRASDPASGEPYRRIDARHIGLIGHSLGGSAGAQVARERGDIGAVVALDADLLGEYLDYTGGKYRLNASVYPAPILMIYADDMVRLMDALDDPNAVIAVKHVAATAPRAYEVHLAGTDHMSLTDLPLISPLLVSVINASVPKAGGVETDPYATIETMNKIVLQFFDAELKSEGSFSARFGV